MMKFGIFKEKYSLVRAAIWEGFAHYSEFTPFSLEMSQCRFLMQHSRLTINELHEFLVLLSKVMKENCEYVKKLSHDLKDDDVVALFHAYVPKMEELYRSYSP